MGAFSIIVGSLGLGVVVAMSASASEHEAPIALVPQPTIVDRKAGEFLLNANTAILVDPDSADAANVGRQLAERLNRSTGWQLRVSSFAEEQTVPNTIVLTKKHADGKLGREAYELDARPHGVVIRAARRRGIVLRHANAARNSCRRRYSAPPRRQATCVGPCRR